MATLYVTETGARIEKEYNRILVTKEDEVLMSVPIAHISEVVLVGWVGATTPAMLSLLDHEVGLTLVSRSGKLRGRLRPPEAHNLPLRQLQFERGEDAMFCLNIGRQIVTGKMKNSRTMLRRWARQRRNKHNVSLCADILQAVKRINLALEQVDLAPSLDVLRGLEGSASRAYFRVYRKLLLEEFSFKKRTRRPPKDPTNALLSLVYSLLTHTMVSACEIVGLDSYDGFFHADKYGRPALALDLVEEFRSVFADSLVLYLFNKEILERDDFTEPSLASPGIYLDKVGFRKFFPQFVRRLNAKVTHPLAGRAISYQKIFEVQARQIRKVIEGEADFYQPFLA
ncbi:CRISPR-associated endonuclease Cas1, partial [bacterium]|nr:CRISPR-associated endonuclease Cas1 [bacterium]